MLELEAYPGFTETEIGRIAEQARVRFGLADLLILRSNPLEAIRHTQEIDAVFKGGKRHSRSDLDEMLHQVEVRVTARSGAGPRPAKE